MAIYHCSIKIVKRSQGKSAVAAAAYRSGEKLTNEWDGATHDYTKKGGIVHSEILLPTNAPPTLLKRSELWNSVELFEKQSDAQLAREIEIALPIELILTISDAGLPLYSPTTHLLRFCSMPVSYKRRITRKKREGKMEFEKFHDSIGAFRRKADYKDERN